jgi:predicted transcriptional regulator of viral defense system
VDRITLARAARAGEAMQYVRGIYAGSSVTLESGAAFAALSLARPGAVVCLLSAAQHHGLSDEDPSKIWMAVDRARGKAVIPGGPGLPVQTVWWQGKDMSVGVETVSIAGVDVLVTNRARTVVDLIRMRAKLGDEPAMKSLRDYIEADGDVGALWTTAEDLGRGQAIEPFVRAAEEFRGSMARR